MTNPKAPVAIQFFLGTDEMVIPEIKLTRGLDGRTGQAIFKFDKPVALSSDNFKEIQGMYLIDEEGQITTRNVNIRVANGENTAIEAIYSWKTESDFSRFMRFANRYAKYNGLSYQEK